MGESSKRSRLGKVRAYMHAGRAQDEGCKGAGQNIVLMGVPRSVAQTTYTPRTKEIASIRLLFPAPFGPITAVKLPKGPIVCCPAYDLKSRTSSLSMRPMVRGGRE